MGATSLFVDDVAFRDKLKSLYDRAVTRDENEAENVSGGPEASEDTALDWQDEIEELYNAAMDANRRQDMKKRRQINRSQRRRSRELMAESLREGINLRRELVLLYNRTLKKKNMMG